MSQVRRQDDFGTLTDIGGSLRLADAYVTVGGRQYKITQLDVAYAGLTEDDVYIVYLTAPSQVATLSYAEISSVPAGAKRLWGFTFRNSAIQILGKSGTGIRIPKTSEFIDVTGTLTYSAGFGIITNEEVKRKISGDSYLYKGTFRCGSVDPTGGKHIQFPFAIDSTKLVSNSGSATVFNPDGYGNIQASTNQFGNVDLLIGHDTAVGNDGIYFRAAPLGSATFGTSPSVNTVFATGDTLLWKVLVPAVVLDGENSYYVI